MDRTIRAIARISLFALIAAITGAVLANGSAGATAPRIHAAATRTCQAPVPGHMTCLARPLTRPSPAYTTRPTPPTGFSPQAISTAYGFLPNGGSGETIALVDAYNDATATANLSVFSAEYGLPKCSATNGCFVQVDQTGGTSYPTTTNRWVLEISLDIEWAHAVAPDAHILLVEATSTSDTNMFAAVRYAAAHAQYVSMSWGGTEFSGETGFDSSFTSFPGVSFFASSGDGASKVYYPSSSPDVISVGGTTLTVTPSTNVWKDETAWAHAGGGCSVYESATTAQSTYPSYDQSGATCSGFRATPDVAFDGNPTTGVSVYDTVGYGGGWFTVGGTSVSSVIMAARSADAAVHVNSTYVYGSNIRFFNVTTGSNGHPCETGYNLCTGLGSWNTSVGVVNGASGGTLSLTPGAQTLTAGVVSGATTVRLSLPAPPSGLSVTVSTTSGGVSTSSTGPFATSVTLTAPGGQSASQPFYAEVTKSGTATLTASASGWVPANQIDTVIPAALARIVVSPATTTMTAGTSQVFSASGYDAYGNALAVSPAWSAPSSVGKLSTASGPTTTFTAGSTTASFTLSATSGAVTGSASVSVAGLKSMTVSVTDSAPTKIARRFTVPIAVTATSAGGPVAGATVTLRVYYGSCGGTIVATYAGVTSSSGTWTSNFSTSQKGSYCILATVAEPGYRSGSATLSITIGGSRR
jgi:hypothetical protein